MFERFDKDARAAVILAAKEEAGRRGDRRVGTEHMLLGLLHDGPSARLLGVTLDSARAASEGLDREALAAVGIEVETLPSRPTSPGKHRWLASTPLTSGARGVLVRSVLAARAGKASRRITTRHLLSGLLGCEPPDPAASLLDTLGVDREAVRARLEASSG
ncbi:MAG: Clp protease N-terminal domain-containing protein [Actinomycetota bacterium]